MSEAFGRLSNAIRCGRRKPDLQGGNAGMAAARLANVNDPGPNA
jgi:hypothetical protein